jgi:serine/threonine protein phosphatase PrpC/aminoglycoside phosphotransferase
MKSRLKVALGQYSDKGCKPQNQDFHGAILAEEPLLGTKGMAMALADGISSSDVSYIASETSVKGFFEDYYATPDSWSVKTSALRVLQANNSWLYAQTRNGPHRYNLDRGYVCTFSALVLKSTTAHLFHVGDARIYAVAENRLEQLTEDHRLWVSRDKSYLSRALGMRDRLEVDYLTRNIEVGDCFLLATDGVYEFMEEAFVAEVLDRHADDLDQAAWLIAEAALEKGSKDNLTVQVVRVDELPPQDVQELQQLAESLPFAPELRPRMSFEGFSILREIHNSSRSHAYLALDTETDRQVVLKTPSIDLRDDADYLERFLMEEWVARRVDNVHLLRACSQTRKRNYLYLVTEYIEGQTLAQWMLDNPSPDLETVRGIVEQIAVGLRALHRLEMLHQDLRPNNILIDKSGTVKIIDFGSVSIAGIHEDAGVAERQQILGTAQYTAPEYFLGDPASARSDQFSLGVIAYQMLSGQLPYGTEVAKLRGRSGLYRLAYRSIQEVNRSIPGWVDETIRRAVHLNPYKRYDELSEFTHDLRHPNPQYLRKGRPPLLERDPLAFWRGLSLLLFLLVLFLLFGRSGLDT